MEKSGIHIYYFTWMQRKEPGTGTATKNIQWSDQPWWTYIMIWNFIQKV